MIALVSGFNEREVQDLKGAFFDWARSLNWPVPPRFSNFKATMIRINKDKDIWRLMVEMRVERSLPEDPNA